MSNQKKTVSFSFFTLILLLLLTFSNSAVALDISLEPATFQREVGGKARVQIFANNANTLISMGVKVSFNSNVVQVLNASKWEDLNSGWLMDADGDPLTTNDQYATPPVEVVNDDGSGIGTVTMFGGRLTGLSTQGLDGKVLLGWIDFETVGIGDSNLNVDLAKYHPEHPAKKFDNFVDYNGGTPLVDEPTNVPGDLGAICARNNACEYDLNLDGVVNGLDVGV